VSVGASVSDRVRAGSGSGSGLGSASGPGAGPGPGPDSESGELQLVWLGPDEWLIIGPDGTASLTAQLLRTALGDELGSIVDVSANRTTLELSGPVARQVLQKGCTLDLHPRAFTSGSCAQTLVSKVNVLLVQAGRSPAYRLLVRGSFAQYLADWMLDAMDEYRFARTGV
jgi:sarcosine oxidase, subunit gamma